MAAAPAPAPSRVARPLPRHLLFGGCRSPHGPGRPGAARAGRSAGRRAGTQRPQPAASKAASSDSLRHVTPARCAVLQFRAEHQPLYGSRSRSSAVQGAYALLEARKRVRHSAGPTRTRHGPGPACACAPTEQTVLQLHSPPARQPFYPGFDAVWRPDPPVSSLSLQDGHHLSSSTCAAPLERFLSSLVYPAVCSASVPEQ